MEAWVVAAAAVSICGPVLASSCHALPVLVVLEVVRLRGLCGQAGRCALRGLSGEASGVGSTSLTTVSHIIYVLYTLSSRLSPGSLARVKHIVMCRALPAPCLVGHVFFLVVVSILRAGPISVSLTSTSS